MKQLFGVLLIGGGLVFLGLLLGAVGVLLTSRLSHGPGVSAPGGRTVTVSGTATATAPADTARVTFGFVVGLPIPVNAYQDGPREPLPEPFMLARQQSAGKKKEILEALDKLNLAGMDVRTEEKVILRPAEKRPNNEFELILNTSIALSFAVEIQGDNLVELQEGVRHVVDVAITKQALFDIEAMEHALPKVTYLLRKTAVARRQALDKALTAALADARTLTGGSSRVEPVEILESVEEQVEPKESNPQEKKPPNLLPPVEGPGVVTRVNTDRQRAVVGMIEFTCRVVVKCSY